MKRILPILIIPLIFCQLLNSQSVVSKGKPFAEIILIFTTMLMILLKLPVLD